MKDDTRGSPEAPSYTPGPWQTQPGLQNQCYITAPSRVIASIHGVMQPYGGNGEVEANARLIAAAPELVEEGQALLDAIEFASIRYMIYKYADRLRAVIRKATGNTP